MVSGREHDPAVEGQQQRAAPAAVGSIVADDAPETHRSGPSRRTQNGAERWQIRVDFATKRVAPHAAVKPGRGGSAIQEPFSDLR